MPASKPKTRKTAVKKETAPEEVAQTSPNGPEDKYAVTGWAGGGFQDVSLPSGQLCLARKVGTEGLLKAGIIHDMDPFKGFIQQHEDRMAGKQGSADDEAKMLQQVLNNPKQMESMFHMLDRVLCYISVKPQVFMTPNDVTRRENGKIYADMVDLQDKIYLMSWAVGKVDDLAQFHGELPRLVDGVQAVGESSPKAE